MGMGFFRDGHSNEVQGQVEVEEGEATAEGEAQPTVVLNVPAPPAWLELIWAALIVIIVGFAIHSASVGGLLSLPFLALASATALLYIKLRH